MNKQDLRVKRTELSLEKALFKLIKKKQLHEISIRELTDEAMISRQTFYAHFETKEELFLACSEHFFVELNNKIISKSEALNLSNEEDIFEIAISYYQKNMDAIKILFSINDKDLLIKSLAEPVKMMYSLLGLTIDEENEEMMVDLISGLTYTMISNWIKKGNTSKASELITAMIKILSLMNRNIEL